MLKTSLQTITWGDPQHHLFDGIFALAAGNGYRGLEIGFRRLGAVSTDDMRALLDKHDLVINASHIGGNLDNLNQAASERNDLDTILDHLCSLKIPYLLYSGLDDDDNAVLDAAIEALNQTAARCAERGVTLLYHNHDWEFANDRRIWNHLMDAASPAIGYAPDLGWIAKADQDLAAVLNDLDDRIKVLHFKDFISREKGQNTSHLGAGIIDFSPAWQWLSDRADRDIWITAEQDNADDADTACVVNGAYLHDKLAGLGAARC